MTPCHGKRLPHFVMAICLVVFAWPSLARAQFGYHSIRDKERVTWNPDDLRDSVKAEDPAALARIDAAIAAADRPDPDGGAGDLVAVRRTAYDESLRRLCETFDTSTPAGRAYLRSRVGPRLGWSLLLFSRRWAVLAARAKSREMLRVSLLAVAVEDLSAGDARDDLVTLAIPLRCVEVAGLDPVVVFRDVAARSGPAIAAMLRDYLERPRREVLGSMGFRQVDTAQGVGFRDKSDPTQGNDE